MNFIDEIYELYRKKLTGDEEDAVALVLNLLEDHNRSDLMKMVNGMEDEEVFQMLAMWLIEMLKVKMAQEELGNIIYKSESSNSTLH